MQTLTPLGTSLTAKTGKQQGSRKTPPALWHYLLYPQGPPLPTLVLIAHGHLTRASTFAHILLPAARALQAQLGKNICLEPLLLTQLLHAN